MSEGLRNTEAQATLTAVSLEALCVHNLGFGADDVVAEMKKRIEESNAASACQVRYEGVKSGDAYARFLCSCAIGLNTQTAKGDYKVYAFPSLGREFVSSLGYLIDGRPSVEL